MIIIQNLKNEEIILIHKLLKRKLFKSAKNAIKNKIQDHITTYTYTHKCCEGSS